MLTDCYSLSDNTVPLREPLSGPREVSAKSGPAASSVTGADLMRLSVLSLQRSLSFNAFAAEKVCNLRDTFLRAGAGRRH